MSFADTMKKLAIIFSLLLVTIPARAEVRLFGWQESQDEKTGEKLSGFFVAPKVVMEAIEADAKDEAVRGIRMIASRPPAEIWNYGIVLKGDALTYPKERLALFEPSPCGSMLEVVSGSVDVDRKAGTVRVRTESEASRQSQRFPGQRSLSHQETPGKKTR